ncbi:hypothetical protein NM688_g5470 [Phlebia brevispora]|uniref:Uncharacterized protein n=1 Tax=Phlebia brevispora TaxID=194682 RepID=A0ACC1SUQ7_9APHY|nr:hypothetical protein NM688_g5470 [Phlebia brevispora]
MRELGIDMGNEFAQGVEEVQFRIDEHGVYQQVLPHELQHAHLHPGMHEPPFPQGQVNGGQTFASTLLLSFSCSPLLKAHLLRTLNMTNEELASFEPIIAQAWDHWDQQRRLHYGAPKPPDGSLQDGGVSATGALPPGYLASITAPVGHPSPYGIHDPAASATNDFRERFHRPLIAPSPFRSSVLSTPPHQPQGVGPSLTTQAQTPGQQSRSPTLESSSPGGPLDPQLGQSRDEAMERSSRGE